MQERERKSLGAYYTDAQVADFLVWWGVRAGGETVLDPSFGGGVFLRSASKRISALGGDPSTQIYGVEIDEGVHARIAEKLADEFGVSTPNLWRGDFFDVTTDVIPRVQVVVGNPPFIRYQRFAGEARAKALAAAASQGVRLSSLASSWAPFVVQATRILRQGGRLAMVLPAEVGHAGYARPVLEFLVRSFGSLTFLTFKKLLFPDLSEETLLLLAEGKGEQPGQILWRDLDNAGDLARIIETGSFGQPFESLDHSVVVSGGSRFVEQFIPKKARDLYRELRSCQTVSRLGSLGDVGIGYVTGDNAFFHPQEEVIKAYGIPAEFLRPAVRRGRDLAGTRFTVEDWQRSRSAAGGAYLLLIKPGAQLPAALQRYIRDGEAREVHKAFKCRTRAPWYSVPHVHQPDALLSYMSGAAPKLVSNEADAVAPNTLHVVRLRRPGLTPGTVAALWQTSLTRLSTEIEGHSLGGGMLKLEPTEAERVLMPMLAVPADHLSDVSDQIDSLSRGGRAIDAEVLADTELLERGLGLSRNDVGLLRGAADILRERRYSRGLSA